jgi:hypothetical protein
MANQQSANKGDRNLPSDFEMPTAREIEIELALGSDSWQSLLPGHASAMPGAGGVVGPPSNRRQAPLRPADA